MNKTNAWFCVECSHELGYVNGRELSPADTVPHANISTRGSDLVIVCPNCGKTKIWYSADPLMRALNQLIDAITTALVSRLVPMLSEATLPKRSKE